MASYDDLPDLIGKLKRARIDAWMATLGFDVTGLAEGLAGQRMQWPEHGMPDYLLLVGAMLCPNRAVAETLAL